MPRLLTPETHEQVERDGLPRVAHYDDGSQHVLYLEGDIVRSKPVEEWGALPADPTPEEIAAAITAREGKKQEDRDKAALKRQRAADLAQSAVGEPIDKLTAKQLGAILALLHPEIVDDGLLVRPMAEWA